MKIAFIAAVDYVPFGGSEELWFRTALQLSTDHIISANVRKWPERPAHVAKLIDAGCKVHERSVVPTITDRFMQKFSSDYLYDKTYCSWLRDSRPDLAVISLGSNVEGLDWMKACRSLKIPYAIIVQVASEHLWPDDAVAENFLDAYQNAKAVFFVSRKNKELVERQFGGVLQNAEIVSNPFNVPFDVSIPFPASHNAFDMAVVGRLDPFHKGHDLVCEVLSRNSWKNRRVRINFYGDGTKKKTLMKFVEHLQLSNVFFKGHVDDVKDIWRNNHILLLPSRLEGTPLAAIEAMLCARPCILTDVGGNADILSDGVTGFLAKSASIVHLSEAMERAWEQRNNWENMGRTASEAIRKIIPENPAAALGRKITNLIPSRDYSRN